MVFRGENMIVTNSMVKSNLSNYSNKNNKISREIKKKIYLKLLMVYMKLIQILQVII